MRGIASTKVNRAKRAAEQGVVKWSDISSVPSVSCGAMPPAAAGHGPSIYDRLPCPDAPLTHFAGSGKVHYFENLMKRPRAACVCAGTAVLFAGFGVGAGEVYRPRSAGGEAVNSRPREALSAAYSQSIRSTRLLSYACAPTLRTARPIEGVQTNAASTVVERVAGKR